MLTEGVPPAMIENAAQAWPACRSGRCRSTTRWRSTSPARSSRRPRRSSARRRSIPAQETLLAAMVERHGRLGRKNGKGFYDYPGSKGQKRLWPGLARSRRQAARSRDRRRRGAEAAASWSSRRWRRPAPWRRASSPIRARPMSARSSASASRPFTGGTLSYIDGMGAKAFVTLCEALAASHGAALRADRAAARDGGEGRDLLRPVRPAERRRRKAGRHPHLVLLPARGRRV